MRSKSAEKLEIIARGFGDLLKKVVFVGGATLDLYLTDQGAPTNRPTREIDCILGSLARLDYFQWESMLKERGFVQLEVKSPNSQLWEFEEIRLRVIAGENDSFGYNYPWFDEAIFHAQLIKLPNGAQIRLFTPAYFIAAKIEAFISRGKGDFRKSEDFEDIVFVLNNRQEIVQDLCNSFYEVREFIQLHFNRFLHHPGLEEGIYYALSYTGDEYAAERVKYIMEEVVSYAPTLRV